MNYSFLLVGVLWMTGCTREHAQVDRVPSGSTASPTSQITEPAVRYVTIPEDIHIKDYFLFMDHLVSRLNSDSANCMLDEYILVHANPWIIDTLRSTDYYVQKQKGKFVYDQSKCVILHKNTQLIIPDSLWAEQLRDKLHSRVVDVNIPEFRMRILHGADTVLVCKVRVGQNKRKFLALAGHEVDLRTPIGQGEIVRVEREPYYIDPETGMRYDSTRRDDGRYTLLPIIPWLEPSIGGVRYGTMIHATTNPRTLGKASSNGCIGTTEADAWTIYYNAPPGTPVIFRYDLEVVGANGAIITLRDIYQREQE